MTLQAFIGEFLTFLEKREERLISWGFYNVQQTAAEIEDAFLKEGQEALQQEWDALSVSGNTIGGLLQQMYQRQLLHLIPGTQNCYRTRFAETVRLVGNLRQMFKEADWCTGPRLVSDIKVHLAPRLYPRRDLAAADVWSRMIEARTAGDDQLMERCFFALAQDRSAVQFKFSGFQNRAFTHIFRKYGTPGISGSVVSAGTGSGKTKAFYIPAFVRIAEELKQKANRFTKVLAVYPRNVLLADQLREALSEADKIRPILAEAGLRPIRFGALLGDTPWKQYFNQPYPSYGWERRGDGFVVPFLKSPLDGRSDLVWRDADRTADRTCLFRERQQACDVPDGVLALTREQLMADPPDVLFVSLEMLNREMGNPQWARAFGIRQGDRAPRLMLLDEVHAYEGIPGAQTAWVLRRWRHWAQLKSLHVVALSATLRDAVDHLSRVAALPPDQVVEFRPTPGVEGQGEMVSEGAEYNMAIKGDPSAGASLLSTSIQTGMLVGRMLTPRNQPPSPSAQPIRPDQFYRSKVFGFSDNLDSINRWFSDMNSAEGMRLAQLRSPLQLRQSAFQTQPAEVVRRMLDEGQIWDFPVRLGYDLRQSLRVTRCSSQDRGADPNSDLIIATSALEVGFDDPDVAAVMQHKRPSSMASFIQRKGRAGRTRGSRPWTVVVLSDYGSDRWAFQAAERLFQPEVDALYLPIANPYVVRVQAALFLVDWLGTKIGCERSPFRYLAEPAKDRVSEQAQRSAVNLLRSILELGATWKEFRRDLFKFYQVSSGVWDQELADSQLDDLLWEEPRPLLLNGIPALLRKLECGWRRADLAQIIEDDTASRPLPKLIPKATFMDLDVGEAVLRLEPYRNSARDVAPSIQIDSMLTEACPGRVSKRFATVPGEPGYWHEFSARLQSGNSAVSALELFPESLLLESVGAVQVYQPDGAMMIHRPTRILDSSTSLWEWQSVGRSVGEREPLPVLADLLWGQVFSEADAFLHENGAWLELIRLASSCRFSIREQGQAAPRRGVLMLQSSDVSSGSPIQEAIGFKNHADGLRFVVSEAHLKKATGASSDALQRLRSDYFQDRLTSSPGLREMASSFEAEWLAQVSIAMLVATAVRRNTDLAKAQELLASNRADAAARVLDVIFQLGGVGPSGQEIDGRLRQNLLALWNNPSAVQLITLEEPSLWMPADSSFSDWLNRRYIATLAQALRSAMCSMSEQVSEDDFSVDVLPSGESGAAEIFIAEKSSGGLGQVETVAREIRRSPRRFLDGVEHALRTCPRAEANEDLLTALEEVRSDGDLASAFRAARDATGFCELEQAKDCLMSALKGAGIAPSRAAVSSITLRLLRSGSSADTDRLAFGLNRARQKHGRKIGLKIPIRTFAYLCVSYDPLRRRLDKLFEDITGSAPSRSQLYAQLQQMILDVCSDSCPECLEQRNPYGETIRPSRALVREKMALDPVEVLFDGSDSWRTQCRQALRERGRACVIAAESNRAGFVRSLPALINSDLDKGALMLPISIAGIRRARGSLRVTLHVKDFTNV